MKGFSDREPPLQIRAADPAAPKVSPEGLDAVDGELAVDESVDLVAEPTVAPHGPHGSGTKSPAVPFPPDIAPRTGMVPEMDPPEGTAEASSARFERWVLPEVEVLLRVARSMTRNSHDAEDLVQDTMVRAFRAIDRFDGRHPRAWLLTIMRNAEINRTRKKRPSLLTEAQHSMQDPVADGGATPETTALASTFDGAVEAALGELSADFRQVVELVDLGGLSYAQAAEVAGVPEGTVMSRLHRARKRIRERLEHEGFEPGRIR